MLDMLRSIHLIFVVRTMETGGGAIYGEEKETKKCEREWVKNIERYMAEMKGSGFVGVRRRMRHMPMHVFSTAPRIRYSLWAFMGGMAQRHEAWSLRTRDIIRSSIYEIGRSTFRPIDLGSTGGREAPITCSIEL